jgi:broad specificity phosphatase PhoE
MNCTILDSGFAYRLKIMYNISMGEAQPVRLHLRRHAATRYHDEGSQRVAGGNTDVPLGAIGKQQAIDLRHRLGGVQFTAIDASPLSRAIDTVRPLAKVQGIQIITPEDGLRERSFGLFETVTKESELERVRVELGEFWRLPPEERRNISLVSGMETDEQLLTRLRPYMQRERPPGSRVLAGTHWDTVSTFILHETGQLVSPDNLGGFDAEVVNGMVTIVKMTDVKPILTHAA